MKRSVLLRQGVLGMMAGLVACGQRSPSQPERQPVEFPLGSTWRIVTATGFYPFVQQPRPDQFEGFDVDLLTAIARLAGVKLVWQKQPFESLIAFVQSGAADVAIGALAITQPRLASVAFSEPYFTAGVAIATAADRRGLDSLKRLHNQRIAVQFGTVGAELAIDIQGSTLQVYNSAFSALQAVADGKADAALCDLPVILSAIATDQVSNLKLAGPPLTTNTFRIAVNKQNPDILAVINQALTTLKANGMYATIYQRWFGQPLP
jgi:arginine/lysine/histidine/glutamine transport system substrate-binding/permease protein